MITAEPEVLWRSFVVDPRHRSSQSPPRPAALEPDIRRRNRMRYWLADESDYCEWRVSPRREFRACAERPTTDTGSRRQRRHFDASEQCRHCVKNRQFDLLDCTAVVAHLQNKNDNNNNNNNNNNSNSNGSSSNVIIIIIIIIIYFFIFLLLLLLL